MKRTYPTVSSFLTRNTNQKTSLNYLPVSRQIQRQGQQCRPSLVGNFLSSYKDRTNGTRLMSSLLLLTQPVNLSLLQHISLGYTCVETVSATHPDHKLNADGDVKLTESHVVSEYLDKAYSTTGPELFPADPHKLAKVEFHLRTQECALKASKHVSPLWILRHYLGQSACAWASCAGIMKFAAKSSLWKLILVSQVRLFVELFAAEVQPNIFKFWKAESQEELNAAKETFTYGLKVWTTRLWRADNACLTVEDLLHCSKSLTFARLQINQVIGLNCSIFVLSLWPSSFVLPFRVLTAIWAVMASRVETSSWEQTFLVSLHKAWKLL